MDYPKITVIVACYDEEKYIEQCIGSLLNQTYKGKIEIIISDGMSTDRTRDLIKNIQNESENKHNPSITITLIDNPGKYQSTGRNLALQKAASNYIAYIDAHSYASDTWLENLHNAFSDLQLKDEMLAGVGSLYLDAEKTIFTESATIAFGSILTGATNNSFLRKKRLKKLTMLTLVFIINQSLRKPDFINPDLQSAEDMELNQRITKKFGYNLYVNPDAVTYYFRRNNLDGIFSQQFNYGFWRLKTLRLLKIYSYKIFAPSLFILLLALFLILSVFKPLFFLIFVAVIIAYFGIIFINSIYHSFKKGKNLLIMMLIYPCIHFGYGLGVLKGIIRK